MTTEGTKSKEYIRPMPSNWWLKRRSYFLFMVRELTCVFVGGYALFLLVLASRLGDAVGFVALLKNPLVVVLQLIALPMVLYHTVTWFQAAAKIQVVKLGSWTMPGWMMTAGALVAWAILSGAIAGYFLAA